MVTIRITFINFNIRYSIIRFTKSVRALGYMRRKIVFLSVKNDSEENVASIILQCSHSSQLNVSRKMFINLN